MKGLLTSIFLTLFGCGVISAQQTCATSDYISQIEEQDPFFSKRRAGIESTTSTMETGKGPLKNILSAHLIKIPVVVHILYHTPEEKIGDEQVISQIEALNLYFRRRNADTINAPVYFRQLGADCEIEFQLAKSDPKRKSTNGIIRKYTPVTKWKADDQMKYSSSMGDDAWDPSSYLNIWVCNLDRFAGYSSMPGSELSKDGIVIAYGAFGTKGTISGYNMGKTAVHELGHWLNLKHLWGDENCGDDGVGDTPRQATYTMGCPSVPRVTCNNGPNGDMYMNFMDFTNDKCINMFTQGQKERMRSLFLPGGARTGIKNSKGLDAPLFIAAPVPDEDPKWLHPQLYPNPARNQIQLDLVYDSRWVGKTLSIMNLQGQKVLDLMITSKKQTIDISRLLPGIYFVAAKKEDGESIMQRFIKL